MIHIYLKSILISFLLLVTGDASAMSWVAWGDWRGYVKPCGCDPKTDLGGIRRIANFVGSYRSREPDALLFDLGNNLPPDLNVEKSTAVLKTMIALGSHAALFNKLEQNGYRKNKSLFHQLESMKKIPWVLSHDRVNEFPGVSFSRMGKKSDSWVALGFSQNILVSYTDKTKVEIDSLIKKWAKYLKNHPLRSKYLLFQGSDDSLRYIQDAKIFDVIISSNTMDLKAQPSLVEKDEPGRLLRLGRSYMVPSFGQGILVQGNERRDARVWGAGKLDSLDMNKTKQKDSFELKLGGSLNLSGPVRWLGRTYDGISPVTDIYEEYEKAEARRFRMGVAKRKAAYAKTGYAGAAVCKNCHLAAWQVWAKSSHSKAFVTLQKQGASENAECVSCHVAGFDQGGFVSAQDTMGLAGVQCENCHGPRKAHSNNPSLGAARQYLDSTHGSLAKKSSKHSAKKACLRCHHPPHSSSFEFDLRWSQIKHGL